jgi:murein tripeptide amidase MpaA
MSWLAPDRYPIVMKRLAGLRVERRAFCWMFELARTQENRPVIGLRIHGSSRPEGESRGVLVVGGAHAREMAPPEAVLSFAQLLCHAYVNGTGFAFGGKSYSNGVVVLLVEVLDLYVIPLLNVDGRVWVETADQMWRKNRRAGSCRGVDLNRNHDFLFSSGIGTSANPCDYDIYRGPSAHSEPETRGIRDLLDGKPHIKGVLDVHAFTGLVLYPWGDDENQSTTSTMTFKNSAWDGQRGVAGDTYREYIRTTDLAFYERTAARMRDGIKAVAGRTYVAMPSFDLYGTSGTLDDYGYARHLASSGKAKAMSMTVEIGLASDGFRPSTESEAQVVRMEGAVAIVEFCLATMCAGDAVLYGRVARSTEAEVRALRKKLEERVGGKRYVELLAVHGGELAVRLAEPELAKVAAAMMDAAIAWSRGERELDPKLVREGSQLLGKLAKGASKELRQALDAARGDLARIAGQPPDAAIAMLGGGGGKAGPKRGSAKRGRGQRVAPP